MKPALARLAVAACLAAPLAGLAAPLNLSSVAVCDQTAAGKAAALPAFIDALPALLSPAPGAAGTRLLAFGAPVQVHCRQGDWLQVTSIPASAHAANGANGAGGSLAGWLPAVALRRDAPTLAALLRAYDALPERRAAQRLPLAQRAVALAPQSVPAHERLLRALEASGDQAAASAARERLNDLRTLNVRQLAGEPQLVFVAERATVRPLAVLEDGKLAPYAPNPAAGADPGLAGIATGRVLHMYGAGRTGKAVMPSTACSAPAAVAPAPGARAAAAAATSAASDAAAVPAAAPGAAAAAYGALLSNAPLARPQSAAPRALTPSEQGIVESMARQVLAGRRIPRYYIAQMMADPGPQLRRSLVALPLSDNPLPMLYAAFALDYALDDRRGTVALTMLAAPNENGTYIPIYKDVDQGSSAAGPAFMRFVVNADLDGDGSEELVLAAESEEGLRYDTLSRIQRRWTLVSGALLPGC